VAAVASDGEFWISKVLSTIEQLEKDSKHVSLLAEFDEDEVALHNKARETIAKLRKVGLFHAYSTCLCL
jgi:DNA polymerase phi